LKKALLFVPGLGLAAALLAFSLRKPAAPQAAPAALGQAPSFSLKDQHGRTVRNSDLTGPWLAAFIYTRCSDQCPLMTQRMVELKAKLPGVRFVSFSVDSDDTPADLAQFAEEHHADWTFVTGGPGVVEKLSSEGFKLAAIAGKGGAPIVHSGYLVFVDEVGRIRGYYDTEDEAALSRLERDWRALTQGLADSAR
jgi:protein SCO1/2